MTDETGKFDDTGLGATEPEEPEEREGLDELEELGDAARDIEAPEADAVEQHTDLLRRRDLPVTDRTEEADAADAAEQARVVELDEDDYR